MMKIQSIQVKTLLAALGLLLAVFRPAGAYFMDTVDGVRPAGMGEAFTGIADDGNAMLFNPAGMAQMHSVEVMGMYSGLYLNLDDRQYTGNKDRIGYSLAGAAIPLQPVIGTFGVAWSQLYSELYWENQLYLSYARRVWDAYAIDAGINLKALNWAVAKTLYTEDYPERSKWGMTLDAGVMGSPMEGLRVGLAADNLIPTDMGLYSKAVTPVALRLGAAYRLPWKVEALESTLVQLELHARNEVYNVKFGAETWLAGGEIGLRTGVNLDQATVGFSYWKKLPNQPFAVHFDYAFAYPFQVFDTLGSHRAGLTLTWDPYFSEQQLAALAEKAKLDQQESTHRLEQTSRELEASEAAIANLEDKLIAMGEELEKAKEARRERQNAAERRAKELDRRRSRQYPVNLSPKIVIGYETKLLSDYAYIQDVREQLEKLEAYLKQQTGFTFERRGFGSAEALMAAFQQGELDLLVPSSGVFVKLYQQRIAKPFLTFAYKGRDFQKYYLFVHEEKDLAALSDLKEKRIGYLDKISLKRLERYLRQTLPEYYPSEEFFKNARQMDSARGGLMALRLQDIDILVGLEYIETILKREMDKNQKIKVLDKYGVIPNIPVIMRTGLIDEKKSKLLRLQELLRSAHETDACGGFLEFFSFDEFVPFQEDRYELFFRNQ